MADRSELLESMLDNLPDGVAILDAAGEVVLWNQAAVAHTGFNAIEIVRRPIPEALDALLHPCGDGPVLQPGDNPSGKWGLVKARHKLGHELQAISLCRLLRDGLGARIGSAVLFHPAVALDSLPHGETGGSPAVATSQQELEERLEKAFEDYTQAGIAFGVIWIGIDQALDMRKTHGLSGCEAMLGKIEYVLQHGLRPAEELGRWGREEYLVIAHERTPEMLEEHAKTLCGLARTTDFRWWGDRVSLTTSIGVVQAGDVAGETLSALLKRAQKAMEASIHAGGNTVTVA